MAEGCPGGLVLAGVSDMKVRMIALAGVSLLAFTLAATAQPSGGATSGGATSSAPSAPPMQPAPPPPPPPPPPPAAAAPMMTQGWYVGVGAGFDRLGNIEEVSAFPGNATVGTDDAALITGEFGYRFADRLRLEGEFGWDQHDLKSTTFNAEAFSGHVSTFSFLANVAYDFPLSSQWDFTLGAGAGVGDFDVKAAGCCDSTSGSNQGFMYQGFAGFDYWIRQDISVNLDWRYRDLTENENYTFDNGAFPYKIKATHDQALMLSIRYYPWAH
jgi:opacity protein-like surface antigen